MKAIKLAFITHFPDDINRPLGGVEAVSVNLVRSLAVYQQLHIDVITFSRKQTEISLQTWQGVTIHRLPKSSGSELLNALTTGKVQLTKYIHSLQVDLIHAHDTYGIMVRDILIPKVFTVHGFIYGDTLLANGRFKWLRSKLWEYVEKGSWAKQKNIISISPYVRERVSAVSCATIYDIDNPIDEQFFTLYRNEKPGIIFSSAVICPRKNSLLLIKAVALLVAAGYNVQLRLAGSVTDQAYAQQQQRWIVDNQLENHVQLLGRISTQEVMKELSEASIYALTSLEENSPMGIEEAMAAGVPVVTSNRCGMPYMVKNGETGYLVDPFSERDIANKLAKILSDNALKIAMAKKSKSLAADLYHSDNVARRTYAVYQELYTADLALPIDKKI